ncbi:hypothetical protein TVAG_470620 [Trichomonas vaginalis G3]|uniref:Uncharacterized protein n=1 Tax=Trichomonas vaginalis (strain ATCC PRA-98 / G3) TaxID=412133 RepID=A2EMA7_TRIV3|nr:armadillo (ARM) repeat-containing protein family [Trichomonas vaginalis G3]EAY06219.1 hypothetical protein TVAG_470620 [Trichomonas vaginalis G3]KAI5509656.1 armadillo (ARM) repeat-containing protein family [Trichomonas vaginalis G3]|eukprot:XP_001318442.1 hypothetical protein [Trichomonas vaginalis G3]
MFPFTPQPFENDLTKFLTENPNADYNTVITHTDIHPTVRNEAMPLVNYLTTDENLTIALKYIFSDDKDTDPTIVKAKRNTVSVFSSVCFKLHDIITKNEKFINAFKAFPKSPDLYNNTLIFGNFARITETLARYTQGSFLMQIDGLFPFLAEHVIVMASRELLTRVLTDFSQHLPPDDLKNLAISLVDALKSDNAYYIASMIKDAIKEKSSLAATFQKRDILTTIMDAAVQERTSPFTPLIRTEIYVLLELLFNQKENLRLQLVPKYENKVKFDPNNLDCATCASLRVFSEHIPDFMDKFFESPPHSYLNECILSVLRKIAEEDMVPFAKDQKLYARISEVYGKEKLNGYIYELANICANNPRVVQQCRGWFSFKDGAMAEYAKERQSRLKNRPKQSVKKSPSDFDDATPTAPKIYYIEEDNVLVDL